MAQAFGLCGNFAIRTGFVWELQHRPSQSESGHVPAAGRSLIQYNSIKAARETNWSS